MAVSRSLHPSFRLLRHISSFSLGGFHSRDIKRALHLCATLCEFPKPSVTKVKKSVIDPTEYGSPRELYEARIKASELHRDSHQMTIIEELESLHSQVTAYEPNINGPGFFSKLFGSRSEPKEVTSPRGLYLYGSVGCGKTMLMDLFFHTVPIEKKQRTHFHEFMLDIHRRIHAQKAKVPRQYNMVKTQGFDPIPPIAKDIAQETWLLCFDEFQVTDIADAMILKRLFEHLWKNGVVVISTSNRHPDDLYKNGLQRIHFLPFIPMVKKRCKTLCLDSGVDYRMMAMPADGKVYFISTLAIEIPTLPGLLCILDNYTLRLQVRIPEDGINQTMSNLDAIFKVLAANEKGEIGPRTLTILARDVKFEKTCGRVMDAKFKELCMRPLGAVDYLLICQEFDTVIIRDIPRMNLDRKVEARRFITLVDTLYDNRVRLVCSADAPAKWLFVTDNESEYQKHFARVLIGDLNIQVGDENEVASIFTGEEEKFSFERAASRLTEMQTEEYWAEREELIKKRHKEAAKRRVKAALREEKLRGTGPGKS